MLMVLPYFTVTLMPLTPRQTPSRPRQTPRRKRQRLSRPRQTPRSAMQAIRRWLSRKLRSVWKSGTQSARLLAIPWHRTRTRSTRLRTRRRQSPLSSILRISLRRSRARPTSSVRSTTSSTTRLMRLVRMPMRLGRLGSTARCPSWRRPTPTWRPLRTSPRSSRTLRTHLMRL